MRKINIKQFRVARRSLSRDINRQIALNLVRTYQPISRAELARRMKTTRGIVGVLVNELINEDLIYEGSAGEAPRGRKPISLHVRTRDRLVVAADVRASRIEIMLCDFSCGEIAFEVTPPVVSPSEFLRQFPERVRALLKKHGAAAQCEGIGIVIPGMVDRETGRIISAPPLGWRDIEIREPIARATGLPVSVESAAKACALAQMWLSSSDAPDSHNFVFVSISDGVAAGQVVGGELIRGHNQIAGEYGHMPMSLDDGPLCACGARGCWMTYISNMATVARYESLRRRATPEQSPLTVPDIIARARAGDEAAMTAIQKTARYLGLGLVTIIHGTDPTCVYVGGELTEAWDLIEPTMRKAFVERALTERVARTIIQPSSVAHPRLRGAAVLIAAPTFAAPLVA
jgi:N-acetylglucosamine repressor